MAQNSLAPYETNFYLAHDQVVHLKTAPNLLCQLAPSKELTVFFSIFELKVTTKHLITGPTGYSEV